MSLQAFENASPETNRYGYDAHEKSPFFFFYLSIYLRLAGPWDLRPCLFSLWPRGAKQRAQTQWWEFLGGKAVGTLATHTTIWKKHSTRNGIVFGCESHVAQFGYKRITLEPLILELTGAPQWFLTVSDAVRLLRGPSWARSFSTYTCTFLTYSNGRHVKIVKHHLAVSVGSFKNGHRWCTESCWSWLEFQNQLFSEMSEWKMAKWYSGRKPQTQDCQTAMKHTTAISCEVFSPILIREDSWKRIKCS